MATPRIPCDITGQDTGVPFDRVSNQITSSTAPGIGQRYCYVLADGGSDEGVYINVDIPDNYASTPIIVVRGILDGVPGASDVLAFSVKSRNGVANNGAADAATFPTEDLASATIGSSGTNHSNEDYYEEEIALTTTFAAGDALDAYVAIDASVNGYLGNFLLTDVFFKYTTT